MFKATSKIDPTQVYAIKCISKKTLSPEDYKAIKHEAGILQEISHPNIVKYHTQHSDEDFFYMVLEYCPNGELFYSSKFDKD